MTTQDSLFGARPRDAPLASRRRPERLADYLGQAALMGPEAPLRRAIEEDRLHSMIFWGPPGSGKTTLAQLVSKATKGHFVELSAVMSGVKDVRAAMAAAVERRQQLSRRTVLFIDEIHRFNKAQQDAFLPHVERGDVLLIGATTENPSFGVIAPLLSRCRVYTLESLSDEDLTTMLHSALSEDEVLKERGLVLEDEAAALLLAQASGDARAALTLLEVAAESLPEEATRISLAHVKQAAQTRVFRHDKAGEEHYNLASAFIKSVRNSDPDAALYWMARMLAGGEDPLFICRRMVILAAEDIGLAAPQALQVAVSAQLAFERIGLPEGEIPMAEACVYLAVAPKSNASYMAWKEAKADVAANKQEPVPMHLRNAATALMKSQGYGAGYRYAHDDPDAAVDMSCLPDALADRKYYRPTSHGHEARIRERMDGDNRD